MIFESAIFCNNDSGAQRAKILFLHRILQDTSMFLSVGLLIAQHCFSYPNTFPPISLKHQSLNWVYHEGF